MVKSDVVILGAGIVGVAAALQLQAKGRSVALVDRGGAGEETSFGNAGIIERASIFPYLFPRDWKLLARYAVNGANEARYRLADLPAFAPFLFRYWRESAPERALAHALAVRPLIEASLSEHEALMRSAGALGLLRRTGWIKLFRNEKRFNVGRETAEKILPFGLKIALYSAADLARVEPSLSPVHAAIHYLDPASISDPLALTQAYLALFTKNGGVFLRGDARSLCAENDGFSVETEQGRLMAREAVVSLGPWAGDLADTLGYRVPMAVKRGYHMHYSAQEGATLNRPVLDADNGYLLAPMRRGIRLTTGAEFACRDSAPDMTQIDASERVARLLFPLGPRLDAKAWLGRRPCLPDMLPVIGEAPRHKGLWFNFGHQHHGLTLAASGGRLLAEMMCGAETLADPNPFRIERFC